MTELMEMLDRLPPVDHPSVIVGTETRDDAAAFRLNGRTTLVSTVDFFGPVVDDPFDYGRVAAANALSDVYAMGARPLFALNIVAFPAKKLGMEVLGAILRGGIAAAGEAGVPIVGGHSVEDDEPKYGLAVVGVAPPEGVITNVGARPGDVLVLTKPLGSGVVTTALKRGHATASEVAEITAIMATLNRGAWEALAGHRPAVHALTDVTGYGLLGHLGSMLEGSGVGARLRAGHIPILDAARRHAEAGRVPGGSRANLNAIRDRLCVAPDLGEDPLLPLLLADAQTSGGLLAAVAPDSTAAVLRDLQAAGVPCAAAIGEVVEGAAEIRIDP